MAMKHIAFDLGAESGRAIVGEVIGGKLEMNEIHRFPTQGTFVNGSLRWDIYRLFSELKKALKKYAAVYGDEPCTMGVDTWGIDFGILDRNGKLCAIPYHYRDKRTVGSAKIIDEKLGLDRLYDMTGIQQMEINSLNQLVAAKNLDDSIFEVGEKLLFIGDLLHYFLCGETKAEYTVATTSNIYSTVNDRWETDVLKPFGIDARILTNIVKAGSRLGKIRADLALESGVNQESVVIAPAVHDTASAAAAVPGQGDNIAYISSGTWSLAGLELDAAFASEQTKKMNIANYGGAFDKILFLKNVMGLWLVQQARRKWLEKNPDLSYAEIVKQAAQAQPFYGLFDPDDAVFINPDDMPKEICRYLKRTGQQAPKPHDIGQVARVIFESLALKYRYAFEAMCGVLGKQMDKLNVIGGGIQNEMLMQFTANAVGVKVDAGPIEATAAGNILIQAYGAGEISSLDELRAVVRNSTQMKHYTPEDTDKWTDAYQVFIKICGFYPLHDKENKE